jgi:hypothetical protein
MYAGNKSTTTQKIKLAKYVAFRNINGMYEKKPISLMGTHHDSSPPTLGELPSLGELSALQLPTLSLDAVFYLRTPKYIACRKRSFFR